MSTTHLQTQTKSVKQPSFTPAQAGLLQRKCACGQHTIAGGECEGCHQEREGALQRAAVNSAPINGVPPIVHDVLSSSGQPLDASTRAFMEPRFEHDFSRVRVHTDAQAAESARSVNALAYTVGSDVVFGTGQYAPGTGEGGRLMAHELTHVVQQSMRPSSNIQEKLAVNAPDDAYEYEADAIADSIVSQRSQEGLHAVTPTAFSLQRSCSDGKCSACAGGMKDLWVTAYFRRRANEDTMAKLRAEINIAKASLAKCCLAFKADFNWTLLSGPAKFTAGPERPLDDHKGAYNFTADAKALGEGKTFSKSRGIPMLVVDEVPNTGGGMTISPGLDTEYTGRNYFVLPVNQPNANDACGTIVHELWHVAGKFSHDAADGDIPTCTSNTVSPTYCDALRALV